MKTITGRNVNEAWAIFHLLVVQRDDHTSIVAPRGVKTLEFNEPVATVYRRPQECVLRDPTRDCNPFFHLYEAFWILAGHNDVDSLRYYNPQIQVYSDNEQTFHGAYGHRLRVAAGFDQLQAVIATLRGDPDSRRGVASLWMPNLDASGMGLDIPCNTTLYFKIRDGALRLTVCNRSNDAVWGAYGANAVQFSIILQYVAACLGVRVGPYTQVSDSLHVYLEGKAGEVWRRCAARPPELRNDYEPQHEGLWYMPLVEDPERFSDEVEALVSDPTGRPYIQPQEYEEPFIRHVALPLFRAHELYREYGPRDALTFLEQYADIGEYREAWLNAGTEWLIRRAMKRAEGGAA